MTTTYTFYNGCHNIILQGSWQDFVQFLCQTKKNSIDRIKEMVTKFSDKPKSQNTALCAFIKIQLLCTAQDYNLAISQVILSQIFDTARNAYCILTRVVFFYCSESWYRPRRDRKLRFK